MGPDKGGKSRRLMEVGIQRDMTWLSGLQAHDSTTHRSAEVIAVCRTRIVDPQCCLSSELEIDEPGFLGVHEQDRKRDQQDISRPTKGPVLSNGPML